MTPRLAFALDAVQAAGQLTLSHFQTRLAVDFKSDQSPVTVADREAERLLRERIEKQFPGEAILGEEEGETGTGQDRWTIDPIDGTKSFISGVPLYATLLSYEIDAEPVLGICYFPALDEMFYAEKGQGAFCNKQPCRVSQTTDIEKCVISGGGPGSMIKHGKIQGFLQLSQEALATRTWSDAYGHALVASGRVDAMIDPVVNRWDISAMNLIVREAGGRCTNFKGEEGVFEEALSSNGAIHDYLVKVFER